MERRLLILCFILGQYCLNTCLAQNTDKNVLQINSDIDDRVGIYYRENEELIGYAPIKLEKKKLRSHEFIVKGDKTEEAYINIPIKEILELNIKPLSSARMPANLFVRYDNLGQIKGGSYDLFVHKSYSKKNNTTRIALGPLTNSIKPQTLLGRDDHTRFFTMVNEGVAYDPIFGTNKNIRTQLCNIFHHNYFVISQCEEISKQEKMIAASHKLFTSVKPTIKEFTFRTFSTKFKDNYYTYGFYNLKMHYLIVLEKDKKQEIEVVNYGFGNADDHNSLFRKALYDNVGLVLTDTTLIQSIQEANAFFQTEFDSLKIEASAFNVKFNDIKEMIKTSTKSVVTIEGEESFGSGFLINNKGYILTNYHVIDDAQTLKVRIGKDTTNFIAKVIRYDDYYDLAVIKIEKENTPYLQMKNIEETEIGEPVVAIGTPASMELGQSVSKGIVSGNRAIEGREYIQTDVSINPGNSGGPLINENGIVIGVIVKKIIGRGMEGLGFAIPAKKAIELMNIHYTE
ncbi:MAG: trypsin-like peptidase domain-containing protein [Bacteroidota bacterium]